MPIAVAAPGRDESRRIASVPDIVCRLSRRVELALAAATSHWRGRGMPRCVPHRYGESAAPRGTYLDAAGGSRRWAIVAILAVAGAAVVAVVAARVEPITGRVWRPGAREAARRELFGYLSVWWLLFALAVSALLRSPRKLAVVVALVGGTVLAVASLAPVAVLSNDVYRYAWDGRLQAHGIDPYRYPPNDPRLQRFHDPWLWPSARGCAQNGQPPGCTRINRKAVRSIYPPGAQLWFRFAHAVLPGTSRDLGYELLGLFTAVAITVLLLLTLHRTGRDPRLIALFTLCPVVPLEAVQNAHVDVVAALLLVASALAVTVRRPLVATLALTVAVLVKLYPLILLPALIQRRRRLLWTLTGTLIVIAYLPYALDVGRHASGYLRGYLKEEGYQGGSRYRLLHAIGITGTTARLTALAVVVAVITLAVVRRLGPPIRAALVVFVAGLAVVTPGEPWYELVLAVLVTVTGAWQWLGIIVADYAEYLSAILGKPRQLPPTATEYAMAFGLGLAITLWRHRAQRRERALAASHGR